MSIPTPAPQPSTSKYWTTIPGLPGGPLGTDFRIMFDFLIPASNTWQRPGIKAHTPRRSVQHDTGNPDSLALQDASWVTNRSKADGFQESMHFECDDAECYCLVPVDEVSWQAADSGGPGNMNGVSCEMTANAAVWGDETRARRAIHVAADILGRCAARLAIAVPEQHWTFNYMNAPSDRHDCPQHLRHDTIGGVAAWDVYVNEWNAAKADELSRMHGVPVPAPPPIQTPTFAKTSPIPAVATYTVVGGHEFVPYTVPQTTVRDGVPVRQFADPGAELVAPGHLPAGHDVLPVAVCVGTDGRLYYVDQWFNRVACADCRPKGA